MGGFERLAYFQRLNGLPTFYELPRNLNRMPPHKTKTIIIVSHTIHLRISENFHRFCNFLVAPHWSLNVSNRNKPNSPHGRQNSIAHFQYILVGKTYSK